MDPKWQKSSFSVGQGACVDLQRTGTDKISIRNDNVPDVVIAGTVAEMKDLIAQLRALHDIKTTGFGLQHNGVTVSRNGVEVFFTREEVEIFFKGWVADEFVGIFA